jgi:hypothetical protein
MVVDFVDGKMVEYPTGKRVPLTGKCENIDGLYRKTKSKSKKFVCNVCGYRSAIEANVKAHIIQHCVRHHFQCVYCGHLFQLRTSIYNHLTGRRS